MKNFIVAHLLNGKLITRSDFGESFADALEFALTIKNESHQAGAHDVLVFEEFTGEVKSLVSYHAIKTDDGGTIQTLPIVHQSGGL